MFLWLCLQQNMRKYDYSIYKPGTFQVIAAKAMIIRILLQGSLGKERVAVVSLATNDYYVWKLRPWNNGNASTHAGEHRNV